MASQFPPPGGGGYEGKGGGRGGGATSSRDPGTSSFTAKAFRPVPCASGDRGALGAAGPRRESLDSSCVEDDGFAGFEDMNPDRSAFYDHKIPPRAPTREVLPPPDADTVPGFCRMRCGREVQPGLTRTMKRFDTCCKKCANTRGHGGHDENCGKIRDVSGGEVSMNAWAERRRLMETLRKDDGKLRSTINDALARSLAENSSIGGKVMDSLTNAISFKADAGHLSSAQVAKGVHDFIARFDEVEARRCSHRDSQVLSEMISIFDKKGKGQIKREDFLNLCKNLFFRLYQEWFPEVMPLSTRTFVQRNTRQRDEVYQTTERLGHGSYGVVHGVEHRISGMRRVCKLIRKGETDVLQEIHSMAMLDHPNVIKVYEYFDDATYISQIIEPCDGGELKARVEGMHKRGESPYGEAFMRDVMKQTMRALAFMHSQRFAHKDLKPENIMMVEKGSSSIKIIDFGLAEHYNPHSDRSQMVGGTLLFMPPEVFLAGEMTMKCDIWSSGVVLYNLITGTYPYIGQWPPPAGKDNEWWEDQTAEKIISGDMAKHEKLLGVSKDCQQILQTMLDKDEPRRPDATQCLDHPWFQSDDVAPTLSVGVVQCVEAYARMSELKKAIFLLMAHESAVAALNELRAIFTHFDVGNKGLLTAQDLRLVLARAGTPCLSAERIVHALDRESTGTIGWTEFLSAALCISICRNEKLVDSAFATFDTGRKGKITVDDLQQVLGGTWSTRLPEFFLEMIPREFRPKESETRRRPLWVNKEQFRSYVGQHIDLKMPGHKIFAVS